MLEMLKKNALMGIGLASMTQAKIKEFGEKLAKEGKLSEKEGKKFVKDLVKHAEDAKGSLEKQITDAIEKAMDKLKPPCLCEIEKLQKDVKELKKSVDKLAAKK